MNSKNIKTEALARVRIAALAVATAQARVRIAALAVATAQARSLHDEFHTFDLRRATRALALAQISAMDAGAKSDEIARATDWKEFKA